MFFVYFFKIKIVFGWIIIKLVEMGIYIEFDFIEMLFKFCLLLVIKNFIIFCSFLLFVINVLYF